MCKLFFFSTMCERTSVQDSKMVCKINWCMSKVALWSHCRIVNTGRCQKISSECYERDFMWRPILFIVFVSQLTLLIFICANSPATACTFISTQYHLWNTFLQYLVTSITMANRNSDEHCKHQLRFTILWLKDFAKLHLLTSQLSKCLFCFLWENLSYKVVTWREKRKCSKLLR